MKDRIDRRYLGALKFTDNATGAAIRRPLTLKAHGLRFIVNLSKLHVITYARGLMPHLGRFDAPPDVPGVESLPFAIEVSDPLGEYLPRRAEIKLPRKPKPDNPDDRNSIFMPIDIPMFHSSNAGLSPNWSIIRASVFDAADKAKRIPVRGALIRILKKDDDSLLKSGVSDGRGEVMIVIPGIPVTDFSKSGGSSSSAPVVQYETQVKLMAVVEGNKPWPVNPQVLENKSPEWKRQISAGEGPAGPDIELAVKTGETIVIKELFVSL